MLILSSILVLYSSVLQLCFGGTVYARAGANVTVPCAAFYARAAGAAGSAVDKLMSVQQVRWSCSGCSSGETLIVSGNMFAQVLLARVNDHGHVTIYRHNGRLTLSTDTYSLHYGPALVPDTGRYWCQLVYGKLKHVKNSRVQLIVQDVPSVPSRPMIQDFDSRSVTLSWSGASRSNNSPINYYFIHTKKGENGHWDENPIVTENNSTQYKIGSLLPFTTYSFRLVAVNGIGASPVGVPSHPIITHWEVPSASPVITAARNRSSTSVMIQWRPLYQSQLRGEFQNYRLTFRRTSDLPNAIDDIRIGNEQVKSYVLTGLQPFTSYVISLQVENPAGLGPSSTVVVSTDEGVPVAPANVTILNVTAATLHVSWLQPQPSNARISGYQLQLSEQDRAKLVRVSPSSSWSQLQHRPSTVLTDLKPYTNYTVRVRAVGARSKGGTWSTPLSVFTDVAAPSQPELISITCDRQGSLRVAWRRPFIFPHTLSAYVVEYGAVGLLSDGSSESVSDSDNGNLTLSRQQHVQADINRAQETVVLSNLTIGETYLVRVRAVANSVHDSARLLTSEPSRPERVRAEPVCAGAESTAHVWRYSGSANGAGMNWWALLSLLVAATVLCLLLATVMLLWRRYLNRTYRYRDEPVSQRHQLQKEQRWESSGPDGCPAPIPVADFAQHVARLHADSDIGFCKEFEEVTEHTMRLGLSAAISQNEENKAKNRYQNIDAYDHSLVPLHPLPGQRRGDYINANFVDGFRCSRQYIAAQGPMCSTLHAFWRLVWEQRVHVIVMITNLVERSRKKCDLYWPSEGVESYGLIQVEPLGETVLATHIVRKFRLRHIKVERRKRRDWHERIVFQYHYTSWPDHGVPDHLLPILNFVRQSSNENSAYSSPILVHCSAGVGRTGAYIVLDAMREMLHCRRAINVFGYLKHIRAQRNFLVQTEDQYVFVHDALLELLRVGDTCVEASGLGDYWRQLLVSSGLDGVGDSSMKQQYQLVRGCQPAEHAITAALSEHNQSKNRSDQFLPLDMWRVYLPHRPGVQGSDYINASLVMGYDRANEFIITQHPLPETVGDFWRMVWHQNVHTIVVLSPRNHQDFAEFWPTSPDTTSNSDDTITVQRVKCSLHTLSDSSHGCQTCHLVQLQLLPSSDEPSCHVQLVHASDWPSAAAGAGSHNCSPVQLVVYMQRLLREQHGENHGPLVVVDRFGGTEAAQFCCLSSLYKQYRHTSCADVYMHARLCCERRPGVWPNQDDYVMLYRTMEKALTSLDSVDYAISTSKDQSTSQPLCADPNSSLDPVITCDENVSLLQSSQTSAAKSCVPSSVAQLPLVEHIPLDCTTGDGQTLEQL